MNPSSEPPPPPSGSMPPSSGSLPPPTSHSMPPAGARHLIAIGGGRGGVGKSLLALNLGVYLAQLGRSVVLVDADATGAGLHTLFGLELPLRAPTSDDVEEDDLAGVPTQVPGLTLVPQSYRVGSTAPTRPGRRPHLAQELRRLPVDYVVLDLGAGTAPATLDLFLGADLGIMVATPEPPSVEAVYRAIRGLFQRVVRRLLVGDRFRMRLAERAQSELGPLPAPLALAQALSRYDASLGRLAATELARLRPRLVVNETRLRNDVDLGPTMAEMSKRHLGVAIDYVGHVEHDDAAWLSVVRRRPLLIDNPTSKSARNIERIARRILALLTTRDAERTAEPVALAPAEPNLYEVLGLHRGATDEELRRAYKRQRENYHRDSLPLTSVLGSDAVRVEQARIEEAHDTLLDPVRKKAYEASTFPDEPAESTKKPAVIDSALEAEREMMRRELSREINAETEFTGRLLSKVRESRGIELEEIAKATKISITHLKAIEGDAFANLPALVYTRGFVQELAKYLKLDAAQVTKTYLRRVREFRATSGGDTSS